MWLFKKQEYCSYIYTLSWVPARIYWITNLENTALFHGLPFLAILCNHRGSFIAARDWNKRVNCHNFITKQIYFLPRNNTKTVLDHNTKSQGKQQGYSRFYPLEPCSLGRCLLNRMEPLLIRVTHCLSCLARWDIRWDLQEEILAPCQPSPEVTERGSDVIDCMGEGWSTLLYSLVGHSIFLPFIFCII